MKQKRADYKKNINADGEYPSLSIDGKIYGESDVIIELLNNYFRG